VTNVPPEATESIIREAEDLPHSGYLGAYFGNTPKKLKKIGHVFWAIGELCVCTLFGSLGF
jgi:hypothetical protein